MSLQPLAPAKALVSIAERVWWSGPPEEILRNPIRFLWQVMDYGTEQDVARVREAAGETLWKQALDSAAPGKISKGAFVFWSMDSGLMGPRDRCDWPDNAHLLDLKPLRGCSRESLIRRHRIKSRR